MNEILTVTFQGNATYMPFNHIKQECPRMNKHLSKPLEYTQLSK
ncbi:hypothetical protein [Nitrosomonas aestuarii]|nr:hypothetical protein [Nitrosomonas aestuarii]